MSLKDQLQDALKDAMRAQDNPRKTTLRGALAAIKQIEVDQQKELDDSELTAVVYKEVKARKEAISDAEKAARADLIAAAEAEIAILEEFLPQPLTAGELEALVKEVIAETGASSMADMGKVMSAIMPKVAGRADGGQISQMVRQLLQNG